MPAADSAPTTEEDGSRLAGPSKNTGTKMRGEDAENRDDAEGGKGARTKESGDQQQQEQRGREQAERKFDNEEGTRTTTWTRSIRSSLGAGAAPEAKRPATAHVCPASPTRAMPS